MSEHRGPAYKLSNMASFQHFGPEGAYDLALYLGRMMGEIGEQDAADKWFEVAAANASGKHPPDIGYVTRAIGALRASAAGFAGFADRLGKQMDEFDLAKKNALAAAERKRLQVQGQKSMRAPGDGAAA